jgi:predicted GTPase
MSSNEVSMQTTIQERLNAKLKDALIDLIPPEVLKEKSDEAAAYFLNGKTKFVGYHADDERRNYRIENDPNTLTGMLFVEMKKRALLAIEQEFDTNPVFKQAYDAAAKEEAQKVIQTIVTENAGAVLMSLVGAAMEQQMFLFANNFQQNLRAKGFNI